MATKTQKADSAALGRKREAGARKSKPAAPSVLSSERPAKVSKAEAMAKISKELKVPKTFGAMADALYTTRERRLNLQKEVDALAAFESKLKNKLIDEMPKKDSSGAAGKLARAQIVQEDQPVTEDWESLYKHIKKTGNFDLLNRALNRSAVKARWENGKEVPGVGHFPVIKVSVTKL